MRQILLSAMGPLFWVIAAFNLLMFVLLLRLDAGKRGGRLPFLMAMVTFGLLYDSLILALGVFLPAGGLLKALSRLRYVAHCALIPLTFPICALALRWKPKALKTVWLIALAVIVVGVVAGFAVKIEPKEIGGVMRYATADTTPAWANAVQNALAYGPVLLLIAAGLAVWIREKNPHLFLSGLFMFAFAALGPATGNFDLIFVISVFGEAFMTLFFYLFAKKRQKDDALR